MAVILSFTAEEVWEHLPGARKRPESVHLMLFPEVKPQYLDDSLADRFDRLLQVRSEVSKALELARQGKQIGNSLEASVTIQAPEPWQSFLQAHQGLLKELFIVSHVALKNGLDAEAYRSTEIEGLHIQISRAPGKKCERCWMFDPRIPQDSQQPSICPRCRDVLGGVSGK